MTFLDTPLGSIPVSGEFPSIGPAQGFRLQAFAFDMTFAASGWNGAFTHNVPAIQAIAGCQAPAAYCDSDPATPGGGTQLQVLGSTSVLADDFTLSVTRAPLNTF